MVPTAVVSALQAEVAQLRAELQASLASIQGLKHENSLLLRRLYGNKTERTHTEETQLAFAGLLDDKKALQRQLDEARAAARALEREALEGSESKRKPKPKGRRKLAESSLPRVEVEIVDRELEGKYPRAGFDDSYQLLKQRAQFAVLVRRTVKYTVPTPQGTSDVSAAQPLSLFPRGILHSSAVADIVVAKFALGAPLYRQEQQYAACEASLDRGTMCRYVEEAGNALGATVVHAMWEDALCSAGVMSTDATGAMIQPEGKTPERRSCRKGHFFTVVADDKVVLFHYVASHTQDAVKQLFSRFHGFLQADASHVYNVLEKPPGDGQATVTLVGCWAHCRRYFFEAAITRHAIGVEALHRIQAIYALDMAIMKLPRARRTAEREARVLPLMREFFAWVKAAKSEAVGDTLVQRALGYATNQERELLAVLQHPEVPLDNTRAERALRKIVVGRKNWLFYGSDTHAESAAALFTLIATCRLHRVEPVQYLDEVMRVLPYWPRERYLELAPHHWVATRAKLDPGELAKPVAHITVPVAV